MVPQSVTHVIETQRIHKLDKYQRHDMTPWRKRPALLIHPVFARQLLHEMAGYQVDNLLQYGKLMPGRLLKREWVDDYGRRRQITERLLLIVHRNRRP